MKGKKKKQPEIPENTSHVTKNDLRPLQGGSCLTQVCPR